MQLLWLGLSGPGVWIGTHIAHIADDGSWYEYRVIRMTFKSIRPASDIPEENGQDVPEKRLCHVVYDCYGNSESSLIIDSEERTIKIQGECEEYTPSTLDTYPFPNPLQHVNKPEIHLCQHHPRQS